MLREVVYCICAGKIKLSATFQIMNLKVRIWTVSWYGSVNNMEDFQKVLYDVLRLYVLDSCGECREVVLLQLCRKINQILICYFLNYEFDSKIWQHMAV